MCFYCILLFSQRVKIKILSVYGLQVRPGTQPGQKVVLKRKGKTDMRKDTLSAILSELILLVRSVRCIEKGLSWLGVRFC